MRKEATALLERATDSLVLAVEKFNCPWDRGRAEVVLILLDRAFELLLKAAILHRGGKIREVRAHETFGMDKCVRVCLSDGKLAFLTPEQALTIQIINSLRDAAQHYIVEVSEQQLYMYCQAGVTLYGDLLRKVFKLTLHDKIPERVLPVASSPPKDLHSVVKAEFNDIKTLVAPGARKLVKAHARLRALAVVEASLEGVRSQPSERDLQRLVKRVRSAKGWQDVFPGVASLRLDSEGAGLSVNIRLTKSEGEPVHLVPEGTPGATIVSVKKVNELGFYSLGLQALADKIGLSAPKALALIQYLRLQNAEDCFKEIAIGKVRFKRYSPIALDRLMKALKEVDMEAVWEEYKPTGRTRHAGMKRRYKVLAAS